MKPLGCWASLEEVGHCLGIFNPPSWPLSILSFLIHRDVGTLSHMRPCLHLHEGLYLLKTMTENKSPFPYAIFSQGTWSHQWEKWLIQHKLYLHNILKFKLWFQNTSFEYAAIMIDLKASIFFIFKGGNWEIWNVTWYHRVNKWWIYT